MAKKKKEQKTIVLTEWQKRNLEFLEKKKEAAAEQERLEENLRQINRRHFQSTEDDKSDETALVETDEQSKTGGQRLFFWKRKKEKVDQPRKKLPLKWRRALPFIVLPILAITISIFFLTPWSKEKVVTVSGNTNEAAETILANSQIQSQDYITSLIFHASRYQKAVEDTDPWVKSAQLSYHFPNRFDLAVTEYPVIAYTSINGAYQPIISTGEIMSTRLASVPEGTIVINLTDSDAIRQLVQSLGLVNSEITQAITTIDLANSSTTKDLLILTMSDGNIIRVPLSQIREKLPYYTQIKANLTEPGIVDMEVGIYTTNASIEAAIQEEKDKATEEGQEGEETSEATGSEGEIISSDQVTDPSQMMDETTTFVE